MKLSYSTFFKGAGMGAADAVPGVSGGTIAIITAIYEELIHTIKQFGPGAFVVWRRGGWQALVEYLNLRFLLPLVAGIFVSLFSVAHVVTWLLQEQTVLLNAFFFGLVLASAIVVRYRMETWLWRYLPALLIGIVLAQWLPTLMPGIAMLGAPSLMLMAAGAIAISAMLLPGVSGSFLLLTMGLYGTVMEGIKAGDLMLLLPFGLGCLLGLLCFSRLLSWLLIRHHDATLQLLIGFIIGSLPTLWPWRELLSYQLGPDEQMIPLEYRYLLPHDYAVLTGESAHMISALALMLVGVILVLAISRYANSPNHSHKEDDSHA